jgi:hypothetical protein
VLLRHIQKTAKESAARRAAQRFLKSGLSVIIGLSSTLAVATSPTHPSIQTPALTQEFTKQNLISHSGPPAPPVLPSAGTESVNPANAIGLKVRLLGDRIITDQGRRFRLRELINSQGTFEVQISLLEDRNLGPTTEQLLLIGRGIDVPTALTPNNRIHSKNSMATPEPARRITTWFIPTSFEILRPIEYYQTSDDIWDSAKTVISFNIPTENRLYGILAAETIAKHISFAISHRISFFEELKQEQLQLFDLEIRIRNLEDRSPNDPFIPFAKTFIADGWRSIQDRIKNENTRDIWLYATGDVALTLVGAKILSFFGKGVGLAADSFSATRVGQYARDSYSHFSEAISQKVKTVGTSFSNRTSTIVENAGARLALSRLSIQERISTSVSFLQSRSLISRTALSAVENVAEIAKGGLKGWKYVGLSSALQIGAETAARPADLFDPNPIVMARKMSSDDDFVQNVTYMTNETFWMTGLAARYGAGKFKTFAIAGALALVNSVSMNILIKGEADPIRIGFDTGWEMVVGNAQTTAVDATALRYFESLAARQNNPRLALVGYVIASVDQGVGYFGYAKATYFIEGQRKEDGKVPPSQGQTLTQAAQIPQPEIKLIPVLAPL